MNGDNTAKTAAPKIDKLFDRRLAQISAVVILGTMMSILDTTIVNVAIDTLSKDFNSPLSTIQWVSTGYLLALATVIPLTGWIADRFGTKRLYMTSIFLFVVGSALSGLAWSAGSLIAFRVLQGLGGGMIMPAGMTILTQAAGPTKVGRIMGVVGVPMLMAPIIGPILGGWLVDDFSWRWIFYVNVPLGIAAIAMASKWLTADKPRPTAKLDATGLAMLSPGLALFVYGLAETGPTGGFTAAQVLGPMIAGVALLGAFAFHALRTSHALIDLRLFKDRIMAASSATSFLFATAFFGAMFLTPLYFQVVRGETALHAGLLIAPQGLGAAIMMPIAGKVTDRFGAGRIVPFGLVAILIGLFSLSQLSADTSYWLTGASLLMMGFGMGSTMMPAMSAALGTLSHAQVPKGTTTLNILQRVGGSIGVAFLSVVLTHQLTSNLPKSANGATGLQAAQQVPAALHHQVAPSIAASFGNTYWWGFGIVALAIIPALMLPKKSSSQIAAEKAALDPIPGSEADIRESEQLEGVLIEL